MVIPLLSVTHGQCERQTYGYLPSRKASPPIGWYQIILLGDRGTCVLTTFPGLHSIAERPGYELATYWSQVQRPNHSATDPHAGHLKNTHTHLKEITYRHKTIEERKDNEITLYDCNTEYQTQWVHNRTLLVSNQCFRHFLKVRSFWTDFRIFGKVFHSWLALNFTFLAPRAVLTLVKWRFSVDLVL